MGQQNLIVADLKTQRVNRERYSKNIIHVSIEMGCYFF